MANLVVFDDAIDADRFVAAFDEVVRATDVLRTRVTRDSSAAVVDTEPTAATDVDRVERADVDGWAERRARQHIDLSTGCYRSSLAVHPDGTASWLLVVHHIATDATTAALLIDRTVEAYHGHPPPASRFYDWVAELEQTAGDGAVPPAVEAGSGTGRLYGATDGKSTAATRAPVRLSDGLGERLSARLGADYRLFSSELSSTVLLTTATAIFLHRLTGETEMTIGVIVRHRRGTSAAYAGPMMVVQPVDVRIDPELPRRDIHRSVGRSVMQAIRASDPAAPAKGGFDAVVNVITAATPNSARLRSETSWLHVGEIDAAHVLRVQLASYGAGDDPGSAELLLDVLDRAAPPAGARRAAEHFRSVVTGLVDRPDGLVGDHTLCTPSEIAAIEQAESAPALPASPGTLAGRLRARLEGDDGVVVRTAHEAVSGDELWCRVSRLAADLMASTPRGSRVGVALPVSIEALVAIYACVVAGRSFVPIDPAQPDRRVRRLAERAGVARLIDDPDQVRPRSTKSTGADRVDDLIVDIVDDDVEAYLLFTSGSSGEPKGVPITRRGLASYVDFASVSYFDDVDVPVAPLFTALTFDLTLTTVFAPLLAGGRLVVIDDSGAAGLVEVAAAAEVNWCKATPSHLEILLQLLPPEHQLSTVVVGGEAFSTDLARRLFDARPDLAVFNEYGPTEAVVGCMIHRVGSDEIDGLSAVSIGRPAPGVELRVVDASDQRVPVGVTGELLIAHAGLTAGYLDDAGGQTGPDPFVDLDGTRFYRSGDLVVRDETCRLTYQGRADEQLKVGGVRLDPLEVEHALSLHPAIERAAVRQWLPSDLPTLHRCVRCGLPDNVPGVDFDDAGVCSTCHAFDRVRSVADTWFRTEADLGRELRERAERGAGRYDCLFLLSGGKDSTYALYRIVEFGFRPFVLTLDNGFISDEAKDNIRRVVEHLDLDHEFATTEHMAEIFRDSLATYSDVCHGCYKTIYTLATNRAVDLGIPAIVTGLSRGQLFETRLIPGQFQADRFDGEAIDRAVVEARKRYHRAPDLPNRLLDTSVFDTDAVFDDVAYVDFYRYVDVELDEMLEFLASATPWRRPSDTGRSSNCLINVVGIRTHQIERGYHNYAEPYAWDVRLGHKERDAAIAELDDPVDPDEITAVLRDLGYTPTPRAVLTAWVESDPKAERLPTPTELRSFLLDRLPSYAIPSAFVHVASLPTNRNGKLDTSSLQPPDRRHRAAVGAQLEPESDLERTVIATWESVLGIGPIGPDDDFFALGGDSLAAITMIVELGDALGEVIPDERAFTASTPRALAAAITADAGQSSPTERQRSGDPTPGGAADEPPPLSVGEQSILLHQQGRTGDVLYNVGRVHVLPSDVDLDVDRFAAALAAAANRHEPLTWTFGSTRRRLDGDRIVELIVVDGELAVEAAERALADIHRAPFDLENGPLLRCGIVRRDDGRTVVVLVIHHVSGDHGSIDLLWAELDSVLSGQALPELPVGYAAVERWQRTSWERDAEFWATRPDFVPAARFGRCEPSPDGFLHRRAALTVDELQSGAGGAPAVAAVAAAMVAVSPFFPGETEVSLVASTRDHPTAEPLVGYFLNQMPVTAQVDPEQSASEVASIAGRLIGEALPSRSYPFARIAADRIRSGRSAPAGSVLVSYIDFVPTTFQGRPIEQSTLWNGAAVADAAFFVEPDETAVRLGLEYSGDAIDEAVARSLLEAFDRALTAIVRRHAVEVATLTAELAPAAGDASVLDGDPLTDDRLVTERIWDHLADRADRSLIDAADGQLTWGQVAARAGQIAAALRSAGVEPGQRVAVRLPRSKYLPAAIVALHAVGAVYVPIDPTYPVDRSRLSAKRAEVVAELSPASLPPLIGVRLSIDDSGVSGTTWDDEHDAPGRPDTAGDDEAYVIFTSGSTGVPDGVAVSHRQLAASTNARDRFYSQEPDRFLLISSISFDSSLVGLFWTLVGGGTIVMPDDDAAHDVDAIVSLIDRKAPSHVLCVPTLYRAMLSRKHGDVWPAHVIVAGEACRPDLVEAHLGEVPDSTLTNEYGPTEATVWATAHRCDEFVDPVPIGRPIAGTWVAVVDAAGAVVQAGLPGELVIGGAGVTTGYLGGGDSSRFVTAAELRGVGGRSGPVFRTGDRVRLDQGSLVFLGRLDDQLNVGGARVEPSEIEAILEHQPGVHAAVVVALDPRPIETIMTELPSVEVRRVVDGASSSDDVAAGLLVGLRRAGNRPRLVAHLEGTDVDVATIRRSVADGLPPTHRPSVYETHDQLPRLPNGKIDRRAAERFPIGAPPIDAGTTGDTNVDGIVDLFREILLVDDVGPDDSFFDLGGDSLGVLELLSRLESGLDARLPVAIVHEAPTARQLAARLTDGGGAPSAGDPDDVLVLELTTGGTGTPVFVLHNLGVNADRWRQLVAHDDEGRPWIALGELSGQFDIFATDYDLDGDTEVESLADRYARTICRLRPTGPVVLIGHCAGGVIAIEVARRLQADGRVVENAITISDWHAPEIRYRSSTYQQIRRVLRQAEGGDLRFLLSRAPSFFLFAGRRTRRFVELGLLGAARRLHLPLPRRLAVRRTLETKAQRMGHFDIERFDGHVTMIRPVDDPQIPAGTGRRGWGDRFDRYAVLYTPGQGHQLFRESHASETMRSVQRAIARRLDYRPSADLREPSDSAVTPDG